MKILLLLAFLLTPFGAQAQECRNIREVLRDAVTTWSSPLFVLQGPMVQAFLQTIMPDKDFSKVIYLFVLQDPSDQEIMVIGARAENCYDGHLAMPFEKFEERMKLAQDKIGV